MAQPQQTLRASEWGGEEGIGIAGRRPSSRVGGGPAGRFFFPPGLLMLTPSVPVGQDSASPSCFIFNKNVDQDVAQSHEKPGDRAGSGVVEGRTADFHRAGPPRLVARDCNEPQASKH